jgi:archaellum biogenesis protein FlaJ (TadC family)
VGREDPGVERVGRRSTRAFSWMGLVGTVVFVVVVVVALVRVLVDRQWVLATILVLAAVFALRGIKVRINVLRVLRAPVTAGVPVSHEEQLKSTENIVRTMNRIAVIGGIVILIGLVSLVFGFAPTGAIAAEIGVGFAAGVVGLLLRRMWKRILKRERMDGY